MENEKLEKGNWRLKTGNWKQGMGNRKCKLVIENRKSEYWQFKVVN